LPDENFADRSRALVRRLKGTADAITEQNGLPREASFDILALLQSPRLFDAGRIDPTSPMPGSGGGPDSPDFGAVLRWIRGVFQVEQWSPAVARGRDPGTPSGTSPETLPELPVEVVFPEVEGLRLLITAPGAGTRFQLFRGDPPTLLSGWSVRVDVPGAPARRVLQTGPRGVVDDEDLSFEIARQAHIAVLPPTTDKESVTD